MLTNRTFMHCLKHFQTNQPLWKLHDIVKKCPEK